MLARHASIALLLLASLLTLALPSLTLLPSKGSAINSNAALAVSPWSDSLGEVGMPPTPQMWQPANWDVQIHTRGMNQAGDSIDSHAADHGSDCSAPPATHTINTWQQAVFACHMHVMTAIADEGYGEVVMTPNQLADWTNGPVTIGFSVSTQRTTARDWIAVDLSPFGEQLSLPFDEGDVDLAGMPKHYIELNSGLESYNGVQTNWRISRESAGNDFGDTQASQWPYFEEATGIPMSATARTPF